MKQSVISTQLDASVVPEANITMRQPSFNPSATTLQIKMSQSYGTTQHVPTVTGGLPSRLKATFHPCRSH